MKILHRDKDQKQMNHGFKIILLFAWMSSIIPVYTFGQNEDALDFQQLVFSIVHDQLQQADPGTSGNVIKRIAQESNLSGEVVRIRLLSLLDTLEVHRRKKTQLWQELISGSGKEVSSKSVEKFLIHLLFKDMRKMLSENANYLLKNMVENATRKAKLAITLYLEVLIKDLQETNNQIKKDMSVS